MVGLMEDKESLVIDYQSDESLSSRRPHSLDLEGPDGVPFLQLDDEWVDRPIIEIFRCVAAGNPSAIAIRDDLASLTYADLLAAMDRLAQAAGRHARGRGVIGILVPNSAYHPVAMLACLASNRAFVPFDLHQPASRLHDMIEAACLDAIFVDGQGIDRDQIVPAGVFGIDVRTCLS